MPIQRPYNYDPTNLDCLEAALSPERMRGYIRKANGDRAKAFELYLWNASLSSALYEPLQILEVSMRNSMNRQLCAKYGSRWFDSKTVFLQDQADRLAQAMKVLDQGLPITASDVVANVSFGFWTDILYFKMYDTLWNQCLHKAFPNRAKGTNRSTLAPVVKELKDLRNRIAHHDAIWIKNLQKDHDDIIKIIGWICPVTSAWIAHHSQFSDVWNNRPSI
jgi:abortive infection bacteriophage resistance protein